MMNFVYGALGFVLEVADMCKEARMDARRIRVEQREEKEREERIRFFSTRPRRTTRVRPSKYLIRAREAA